MTRTGYTAAHLGLLVAYLVIAAILMSAGARGWPQIAAVAGFLACWHAISARRIAQVGRSWMHLAPYVSLLGLPFAMIFVAEAQGQSAPLPQDVHPVSAWQDWATAAALTALLVWPAVTIALSILPTLRH